MESVNGYKSQLLKHGEITFVPKGNSMWPFFKNSAQSVVIAKKSAPLKVYDVAFYERENGEVVLHRVVAILEDGYLMQGDSHLTVEPIKEECVFGVMIGFYRKSEFIPTTDKKYTLKVEKWYKKKLLRKIKIKCFYFRVRLKNLFKRIFS